MLLVLALIYDLAVTALDVKDAFLMVSQNVILSVKIPQWIRRWTGSSNAFPGKETQHCVGISKLDNFVNKPNLKHFQEHQQSFDIEMSTERCLWTYMWMISCWCASLLMLNGFNQELALR